MRNIGFDDSSTGLNRDPVARKKKNRWVSPTKHVRTEHRIKRMKGKQMRLKLIKPRRSGQKNLNIWLERVEKHTFSSFGLVATGWFILWRSMESIDERGMGLWMRIDDLSKNQKNEQSGINNELGNIPFSLIYSKWR